ETEHYLMSKWFGVDYSGQITSIGIPGSSYSIDPAAMTIALTVPYGTNLATLAPTVTVTSGTCSPASGTAPSPSFAVQNPTIYTVNDAAKGITNEYTVTVSVTPAATGTAMTHVAAAGGGYAWATDSTGLNLELVVPSSASLNAVAATFTLSPFATCSPPSGTVRDFTSPQTYTVTAQDGTTQTYSLTLQKITTVSTGYQELVLASAPVSYWPLNEATGATTALDIASGLNNITYGGTYTLGSAGLRSDGNPSVFFNGGGSTRAPFSPSLNPTQFSVECWVKPTDSTVQYLVALQDRTTGSRTGYAIWKNNGGGPGFGMQWTSSGTTNPIINAVSAAVAGTSYHVVGTYDGTTFKLYVNGVLENSADSTYVPASPTQPGFTIGTRNGSTGAPSYIQDVALYSRALTPAEILSHYHNAPPTLSYADWATAHGIGGQPASGDADGDGMSNFQEYAFGLNPTSGSSVNPISVPFNKATGTFSYTRTVNTGLTYTVWHSADLVTWTSTGATQGTPVASGGDIETVPVTLDASLLSAAKLFVRVQAQ
ncbi:MAG: LamG-like jellyroll fold domain-containing protein, partial [Verrucomicrobiota bacterium]